MVRIAAKAKTAFAMAVKLAFVLGFVFSREPVPWPVMVIILLFWGGVVALRFFRKNRIVGIVPEDRPKSTPKLSPARLT